MLQLVLLSSKTNGHFSPKKELSNSNCMKDIDESSFNNILLIQFILSNYAFYNNLFMIISSYYPH